MSIRSFVAIGGLLLGLVAGQAPAATGPVLDADADGVGDDRDACPYTPAGISVRPDGCSTPGDEDEDGVPELADACPLSPAGAVVDGQGCALDEDVDGVADGVDRCPMSPFAALVNANGCAPGQVPMPGLARRAPVIPVQPPAAPRAAVPYAPPAAAPAASQASSSVSRPTTPAAVPVVAAAPSPFTPAGATAPAASQIVLRSEPERTYYFDEGESVLSWAAERSIKQSARDLLPELEKNPAMSLVLSGHADTKSDGASAPRLATARARAVRDQLIASGVPAQRISFRVPGVGEPRFFGASLGRNCRVELRVQGRQGGAPVAVVSAPVPVLAGPLSPAAATPTVTPAPAGAAVAVVHPAPVAAAAAVAAAAPPASGAAATLPPERGADSASVTFSPYSAMLDDEARKALDAFVQSGTRTMLADVAARVVITSGIDAGETGAAALRLAESRAASVRAYLVSLGLPRNRMEVSSASQTGARRTDLSIAAR